MAGGLQDGPVTRQRARVPRQRNLQVQRPVRRAGEAEGTEREVKSSGNPERKMQDGAGGGQARSGGSLRAAATSQAPWEAPAGFEAVGSPDQAQGGRDLPKSHQLEENQE